MVRFYQRVQVGDGAYPGVSGYGNGAMMTHRDYGKFLTMVARKGVGANGNRVIGEQSWKNLFAATNEAGTGTLHAVVATCFNHY